MLWHIKNSVKNAPDQQQSNCLTNYRDVGKIKIPTSVVDPNTLNLVPNPEFDPICSESRFMLSIL